MQLYGLKNAFMETEFVSLTQNPIFYFVSDS